MGQLLRHGAHFAGGIGDLAQRCGVTAEEVNKVLELVQSFDPPGVAARKIQECLLLQIRHLGLEGTPTEKIVAEHLADERDAVGGGRRKLLTRGPVTGNRETQAGELALGRDVGV